MIMTGLVLVWMRSLRSESSFKSILDFILPSLGRGNLSVPISRLVGYP
jgi:hypothetical protein